MRLRVAIVVAVAWWQTGCYNYLPLRRSQVVPSMYLAVTLTQSGTEELTRYLGPEILVVRGRFLSATERGLTLSVSSVETRRGGTLEWRGETVVVPGDFVWDLEERHVARVKTVLLAGASVAGFFLAYAAFGPGATGTTPSGGGGGPAPH
jgi:hypothetical protein